MERCHIYWRMSINFLWRSCPYKVVQLTVTSDPNNANKSMAINELCVRWDRKKGNCEEGGQTNSLSLSLSPLILTTPHPIPPQNTQTQTHTHIMA